MNNNSLNQQNNVSIAYDAQLAVQANTQVIIGDLTGQGEVGLNNNSMVIVGSENDATFDGRFAQFGMSVGNFEKVGSGSLTLTGNSVWNGHALLHTGSTTVSAGSLIGSTAAFYNKDIINNATVVFDQDTDGTYAGVMSGSGELVKEGTGMVTLSGLNTYSGGTRINGGTLDVVDDTYLGDISGDLTFNGGTLRYGSDFSIERNIVLESNGGTIEVIDGVGAPTINGVISGTGSLTKAGEGSLFLADGEVNTYSGGTIVNDGHLIVYQDANLGDVSGDLTLNGGAVRFRRSETFARNVVLGGEADISVEAGHTATLTGVVSGSEALNLAAIDDGTLVLDGVNTYTGGTNVNVGTLRLGSHGSIVSTGDLTIAELGTFDLNGNTQTVATLSGAGNLLLGDGVFTTDSSTDSTFSGVISGDGSFVKQGSSVLTLSGTNTYSGGTSFNDGVIAISSDANLGTGKLTFNGGTLRTDAAISTGKTIELGVHGGTFDTNGFDSTITTNSFNFGGEGTFTKTGEGTLTVNNAYGIAADVFVDEGTLQFEGQVSFFNAPSVTVNNGGLFRADNAAPNVVVNNGGTLEAGTTTDVGHVYLQTLTMNEGAILNMRLGEMETEGGDYNDFFQILGDVTLNGTLNLSNSKLTEFEFGTYALMAYTGTLTNNGITVGDMPEGITDAELQFLTDINRVKVVLGGALFFNGDVTTADGTIHGGSGVWDDTTTNWTNPNGTSSSVWKDKVGVFAGLEGGTVTIVGEQTFTGLQFSTNGYELVAGDNGSLLLNDVGQIRVDDAITATIAASLTGTGSLEKLDHGTLILSGSNTYTGGTTVTGGTLQGDTNSLRGSILNNATVAFDQDTDGTYSGIMSGNGTLVKDGTGNVTLAQLNSYSGGTTINSGAVSVFHNSNLGNASGVLTFNGGTLNITSSNEFERDIVLDTNGGTISTNSAIATPTLSGEISGSGALSLSPTSGFVALTGQNTYAGGTTVNQGYVKVNEDANLGAVSGDLTLNSAGVMFNQGGETFARDMVINTLGALSTSDAAHTVTWSGDISGDGNLVKLNPGTVVLDGTNSYTGGTTVSGGVLQMGAHGSLASTGDLTILADAIFDLNGITQTIGTLSGAGDLLLGDGALTTDSTADSTFSGIISGTGSFAKDGAGTLTLTGDHLSTGEFAVEGGQLVVNGSLAGTVSVGADGRLSGNGVFGSLFNQGLITPGNSIGGLTVSGNASFLAGGTLEIEINHDSETPEAGVNNDFVNVEGSATLGGTVSVLADNADGGTNGRQYTFLRAGLGFGGTEFEAITDNLAFFDAVLGYATGSDDEEFAYFWLKANETHFVDHSVNYNQWQIANYLDQNYQGATGEVEALYNLLMSMTDSQLAEALTQMTGEVYASMAQLAIQNILQNQLLLRQNLFGNTAAADWLAARNPSAPIIDAKGNALVLVQNPDTGKRELTTVRGQNRADWRGWTSGYGVGGMAGSDGNAGSARYRIGGTVFGADQDADELTRLGFYGSYANLNINTRNGLQSTESNAVQFGSYLLRKHLGSRYSLGSFGIGFNDYDAQRRVLGQTAIGDTNGWQANTWLEHGFRFEGERATLQPFTALQYMYVGQNDFRESGAGILNLDVDRLDTHSLRGVLGASVATPWETRRGLLTPSFHAMWLHEFLENSSVLNTTFTSMAGPSFATRGLDYGRDWAVIGTGLQWETGYNWSFLLNYDIQFNAAQTFHMGSGALQFQW